MNETPAQSGEPPVSGDRAQVHPVALRGSWVEATEAALPLSDPHQFMRWMERYLRPVLGYERVVCATGHFTPQSVAADRLLVRDFPEHYLESRRDAAGVIVLPRGKAEGNGCLRTLESPAHESHEAIVVALDVADTASRYGSYFLFGRLRASPDARQKYLCELLAPHMRAALGRSLAHEPALHPRFNAQVPLTRRELELLHWLVAGRTTGEIARFTYRSAHTVSNQVRAILRKLGACNRTEAIAVALGLGLVPPIERQPQTRVMAAQPRATYQVSRTGRNPRVPVRLAAEGGSAILRVDT